MRKMWNCDVKEMSRMSEVEEKLKEVLEIIKFSSEEAQEYKDANDFMRGSAFAYRCVLNLFKEFGLDKE